LVIRFHPFVYVSESGIRVCYESLLLVLLRGPLSVPKIVGLNPSCQKTLKAFFYYKINEFSTVWLYIIMQWKLDKNFKKGMFFFLTYIETLFQCHECIYLTTKKVNILFAFEFFMTTQKNIHTITLNTAHTFIAICK